MGENDDGRPREVWNSANFDRPRREMLRAAAKAAPAKLASRFPTFAKDITWLLKETDKLEEARNNIMHSPLYLLVLGRVERGESRNLVSPEIAHQNPRALKLEDKGDLLTEFEWCRAKAIVLRDLTMNIDFALRARNWPWPDIPQMPNREQKKGRLSRRRPSDSK
jgi:hypothetical protein